MNQKSEDFPTENNFEIQGVQGDLFSIEKTITPKDDYYCIKKSCVYKMMIVAENIDEFTLESVISTNTNQFDFSGDM